VDDFEVANTDKIPRTYCAIQQLGGPMSVSVMEIIWYGNFHTPEQGKGNLAPYFRQTVKKRTVHSLGRMSLVTLLLL
jgi:hypothetical protein